MQNQYKNSAVSPKPLVLVSMANSVPDSDGPASTSQRLDLVLQTALSLQTVHPPLCLLFSVPLHTRKPRPRKLNQGTQSHPTKEASRGLTPKPRSPLSLALDVSRRIRATSEGSQTIQGPICLWLSSV